MKTGLQDMPHRVPSPAKVVNAAAAVQLKELKGKERERSDDQLAFLESQTVMASQLKIPVGNNY